MSIAPLLEIAGLSLRFPHPYGDVPILDNISLSLPTGDALGLVGESGSGKSLLGLAILGMLPKNAVTEGKVFLDGVDMLDTRESIRARLRGRIVSYVYQDALSALNPIRKIGHQFRDVWLSTTQGNQRDWRRVAIEALDRVSLRQPEKLLTRYPAELSGGMRQRVLIAMAVARRPRLLVADEPTTALDRSTALDVVKLLDDLRTELGMALLLISHDLGIVRRISNRIAVIYAGQLCEVAPARRFLNNPHHRYSAALLDAVQSLFQATYPIAGIPGVVPTPQQFGSGCRFQTRCTAVTPHCDQERPQRGDNGTSVWCHNPIHSTAQEAALQ